MNLTINRKIRVNGLRELFRQKISKRIYFKDFEKGVYRLLYVVDGNINFWSGDERIPLRVGEVTVCRAGEISFAESTKPAEIIVISCDISGAYIDFLANVKGKMSILSVEKLNQILAILENESENKEDYLKNPDAFFLHEIANCLEIFFLSLAINKEEIKEEKIRLSNEFKEIIEIMRNNVEKPLTVKDIALLCGMSESSLKKIFAKYSACSIHKYFLKMKIFKAIELLDNNLNVSEISEKLSFNNQNYFGVVFKKETGYSPLNYKKIFLRK